MGGQAFGLDLFVDEVVTDRDPPWRKIWRTVGQPRLVVIDGCEMGFGVTPERAGSRLRVWIDHERTPEPPGKWLPWLAEMYSRWCVDRMAADAVGAFGNSPAP